MSQYENVNPNVTMSNGTYIAPNGRNRKIVSEIEGTTRTFNVLCAFLCVIGLLPIFCVGIALLFFF